MSQSHSFKTYHTGPVTDKEPVLVHDLPQDRIISALVTLAGELYMVRDRVKVLEAELEKHDILPPDAVETHEDTKEEAAARTADAQAFADRFWLQLTMSDEPVSTIDPAINKYLDD
ncbi:MAG: hypothetical protein GKS03_05420 [Alphaproteobacteria bacterium]|nr:hypothetical protein [Alphaproteobacteria bacterium]